MFTQVSKNIKVLDKEINRLQLQLCENVEDDLYSEIIKRIETLTELRCKLSESKVGASHSKEIVSGLIGIAGMVLVLKHEQSEIITTKAFNMILGKFKG